MNKLGPGLILFAIFTIINGLKDGPIVEISDGLLRGTINQTRGENKTYYAFRGIPYAQPPIDILRFSNPVKNDKWNGTLDATADSEVCFQPKAALDQTDIIGSEDCLYINVYTTNLSNQAGRPVIVWIYGGAFIRGSSTYSEYGPDYILEKDVVYVSFNYRVGVFGFLSTGDLTASGNWGLKDQVLALKWIQENIAAFGGDPNKVTIFGESAGAASVSYLLQAREKTEGLFRGAILNSGNTLCLWTLTRTAREFSFRLGELVGINVTDSTELVRQLRKVDAHLLTLAQMAEFDLTLISSNDLSGLPIGPVQEPDHDDAIFSSKSFQQLLDGDVHQVPLLMGFTSLEAAIIDNRGSSLLAWLLTEYNVSPTRLAPYDMTSDVSGRTVASSAIKTKYFGSNPVGLDGNDLAKFVTVDEFIRPTRKYVELASNYTSIFLYQWSYKGNLSDYNIDSDGAAHGEDLSYIFTSERIATPDDIVARERLVTMWTNFVKELNPTPSVSDVLQNVTWLPNAATTDTDKHVQCLNITTSVNMVENPFQNDWEFYENLYNQHGNTSFYDTY